MGSVGEGGGRPHKNSVSWLLVGVCQGLWFLEVSQLTCGTGVMLTGWSSTPGSSEGGSLMLGGPPGVWAFHEPPTQGSDESGGSAGPHLQGYQGVNQGYTESLKVCWGGTGMRV